MIFIEYRCGDKILEVNLSDADIDALDIIGRNANIKNQIELLFDCESPGAADVERSAMLQAITVVAKASLSSDCGYKYEFDFEIGGRMLGYSAGTYKGFKINGEIYEIEGGYEKLNLHRYGPVENDRHYIIQTIDIRDRNSLEIDCGKKIIIRKRKARRRLAKIINVVQEFMLGVDGVNITKVILD